MPKKTFSIRLDEREIEILKKYAKIRGMTVSEVLRSIIDTFFLLVVSGKTEEIKKLWDEFVTNNAIRNNNSPVINR